MSAYHRRNPDAPIVHDAFAGCRRSSHPILARMHARRAVRVAMEELCGEGRVALACAPRIVFTDAAVDLWADTLERQTEGHIRQPRINPHD